MLLLPILSGCGAKTGLSIDGFQAPRGSSAELCSPFSVQAERPTLDAFILLDESGSMNFQTADGTTKAQAMREALGQFFSENKSQGLGVALTFFPIEDEQIPEFCTEKLSCGEASSCTIYEKMCFPSQSSLCSDDSECPFGEECHRLGACSDDIESLCYADLSSDFYCDTGQTCDALGGCNDHWSCREKDYKTPAISVSSLPEARTKLLLALDTQEQRGGTTTLPALKGVFSSASRWQAENTDHKAIVILATDGFPTLCDPAIDPAAGEETSEGIPKLVDVALENSKTGLLTFVIGVFSPEEEQDARVNLSQIAKAGDTDEAFIVTTNEQVSGRLIDALAQIRDHAGECEFSIPWPNKTPLSSYQFEVGMTASSSAPPDVLFRAKSRDACPNDRPAYYFDEGTADKAQPGRVILCPIACSSLLQSNTTHVTISGVCNNVQ